MSTCVTSPSPTPTPDTHRPLRIRSGSEYGADTGLPLRGFRGCHVHSPPVRDTPCLAQEKGKLPPTRSRSC
eukprot:1356530-Alexandrium_andersonii.AAC.1